jgi:TonB family protein
MPPTFNRVVEMAVLLVALALPTRSQYVSADTEASDPAEALVKAGRLKEAEAMYRDMFARNPGSLAACARLAGFLLRPPSATRFDDGMEVLERCVPLGEPGTLASRHADIAKFYWDKAYRDPLLTDAQKNAYAERGLGHTDRAIEINPNLIDAVAFKGLLLRVKANTAAGPERADYLEQALAFHKRALDLKKRGVAEWSTDGLPLEKPPAPPPPPPPGHASAARPGSAGEAHGRTGDVGGVRPLRVGGAVKEPRRVKDVPPVYPGISKEAGIQGVVKLDCTIGPDGKVVDVKVLRSMPTLDDAAAAAVRQWEFAPTLVNGVAVPVVMTVSVKFALPSPPPEKR